jgi:hypothetical protein
MPNALLTGGLKTPLTAGKRYISVTAVNRGTAPTTITTFCGYHAKTRWDFVRGRRRAFIIPVGGAGLGGQEVPHVLPPGEEWRGMAEQQDSLDKFGNGYLYIGVKHNQRKRLVLARLSLSALTPDELAT